MSFSITSKNDKKSAAHYPHIDSLPYDLLSVIFQFCLLNHRFGLTGMGKLPCAAPSNYEAPLLLMRVCRKWHDFALSTPTLWSRIAFGEGHTITVKPLLDNKMKEWLDRAGSVPLCIDFSEWTYLDASTQAAVDAALLDIFKPSRAWKMVFLQINGPTRSRCVDDILQAVLKRSPMLESFKCVFADPSDTLTLAPIEIGDTPCLTSLAIASESSKRRFYLSLSSIQFYNIRQLTLRLPVSNNHCLEILDRCPYVEVLDLNLKPKQEPWTRTCIQTLDNLHTLRIFSTTEEGVGNLIGGLSTPALSSLTMKFRIPRYRGGSGWPHLTQLLARSRPPLTSLALIHSPMLDDDIIKCLQHCQALTTLSGDRRLFTTEVMAALTPSFSPYKLPLCPAISTIRLEGIHHHFSAVVTMIHARWQISNELLDDHEMKLQTVAVEVQQDYFLRFVQHREIQECREGGMVIESF
ncbi:hypothetical protein BD410DRAFT_184232 [Rickenella mellea]|uniref:Uncharacterized protein n=1 Tax=Rickenella mellea TaxID=50990 RepID=A0A4Y7Q7T5_9AGAM|nr:hypothetical protein BD410DRAFT_184232 [Rickenella mellea]